MKAKISLVTLLVGGCLMIGFAAKVETCADKFTSCSDSCTNVQAHCKASGSDPGNCEIKFNRCMNSCEKAKKDCEGKK